MASAQLKLITDKTAATEGPTADPARRVFEHWVFMLGRSTRRCKMGPTRTAAIRSMLTLYEEETLLMAVEGMAADPLDGVRAEARDAMRELEWLLGKESRVERWADAGERLRERAERRARAAHGDGDERDAQEPDPAQAALARERLRALAATLRGSAGER